MNPRLFVLSLVVVACLGCGDDGRPTDAAADATADSTTIDADAMCLALGEDCDGTIPCCAPNGCAGGMCGAPRTDAGADGATCALLGASCATLPCCDGTNMCGADMICQPGPGS